MSSFFEPDTSLFFDPCTPNDDLPSSFLSFSSFAALANVSSPFALFPWDNETKNPPVKSNASHRSTPPGSSASHLSGFSHDSDSSCSPRSSSEDYTKIEDYDNWFLGPITPPSRDFGLLPDVEASSSQINHHGHFGNVPWSWSNDQEWSPPATPTRTLLSKPSTDTITPKSILKKVKPCANLRAAAAASEGTCNPRTINPAPLRTTSNPELAQTARQHAIKSVVSMPSLREDQEVDPLSAMDQEHFDALFQACMDLEKLHTQGAKEVNFPGLEQIHHDTSPVMSTLELPAVEMRTLVEESKKKTTPNSRTTSPHVGNRPLDSTLFSAFQEGHSSQPVASSSRFPVMLSNVAVQDTARTVISRQNPDGPPSSLAVDTFSVLGRIPTSNLYTQGISMGPTPSLSGGGESSGSVLSAPISESLTRSTSCSSDYFPSQLAAPVPVSFSHSAPPAYDQHTVPHASMYAYDPSYPNPGYPMDNMYSADPSGIRRAQALAIHIHDASSSSSYHPHHGLTHANATSYPVDTDHILPGAGMGVLKASPPRRIKPLRASKPRQNEVHVNFQHAPHAGYVSPPLGPVQYIHPQHSMGTVHPPPLYYSSNGEAIPLHNTIHPPPAGMTTRRVHPPPHPGHLDSRPIAGIPSTPISDRARRASVTPAKRGAVGSTGNGKKSKPPAPGGFNWADAEFVNYTPDDAHKLLTGVAPSGSASKRKREEGSPTKEGGAKKGKVDE